VLTHSEQLEYAARDSIKLKLTGDDHRDRYQRSAKGKCEQQRFAPAQNEGRKPRPINIQLRTCREREALILSRDYPGYRSIITSISEKAGVPDDAMLSAEAARAERRQSAIVLQSLRKYEGQN
jgi:hypothetical protein